MRSLRQVVEVAYGTKDIWDNIGYVAITGGTLIGGTLVWYLFMKVVEFLLLYGERKARRVWVGSHAVDEPRTRTWGNVIHLSTQTVFLTGVAFIIWFSSAASGFNPWTSAVASLALSVIVASAFSTPLSLVGCGYINLATSSISVGEHVSIHGMDNCDGIVCRINLLNFELLRTDANGNNEIITVPVSYLLSAARRRNFTKEIEYKRTEKRRYALGSV